MDPILDARLKGIEEKLDKNQEILVRIRRVQRHGNLFKIFYWTLIVLMAFGALYYVQPYLGQLISAYTGGDGGPEETQNQLQNSIPNLKTVNSLLDQLKGLQQ